MKSLLLHEFEHLDLGDVRRNQRAAVILRQWSAAPAASFPTLARGSAGVQGLYGFVENDSIDYRDVLEAHVAKSCQRLGERGDATVLVIHDTTTFTFSGEQYRDGLGWVTATKQGFEAHFSLAVSTDPSRCPLGVVGLSIVKPDARRAGKPKREKRSGKQCAADPERDTRWIDSAKETSERLRGVAIPIHVMDRAGDGYEIMGSMVQRGQRFVIRANFDRAVWTSHDEFAVRTKLRAVVERAVPISAREVQLSRRYASKLPAENRKHAPRDSRTTKLEFAAETVRLRRTKYLKDPLPETIDINVVHVREVGAPPGMDPVDWILVTTEPISTEEEVLRVVDYYRARWTIEEFFKAIKTGCNYERRQLESAHALLIALALCTPIAWQLLAIRHQSRHRPDRPASDVIDADRLAVLAAISQVALPASPTVKQVSYAIAALGGHIASNGPPGWQTLRNGMERLLTAEWGWKAHAAAAGKCDQ